MTNVETWGVGCQMCAYTGEGWLHGTLGGDGWTGKPCPHCVEGGEFYTDDYPGTDDDAPPPAPLAWCSCDKVGVGTCPTCGGEMCPL